MVWTRRQSIGRSNYWCTFFSKKARHEDFTLKGTGTLSKTLLYGNLGYDGLRRKVNDGMVRIFQNDGAATFHSVLFCNYLCSINGTGLTLSGRHSFPRLFQYDSVLRDRAAFRGRSASARPACRALR